MDLGCGWQLTVTPCEVWLVFWRVGFCANALSLPYGDHLQGVEGSSTSRRGSDLCPSALGPLAPGLSLKSRQWS